MISTYPSGVVIRDFDSNNKANVNVLNRLEVESLHSLTGKIHEAHFYTTSYVVNSLANNSSIEILIITGSNYPIHATIATTSGGDSEFYFFEDTTVSANGTALTAYNNNRTSSNTTEANVYHTPTITTDGTELYHDFLPGGAGGQTPGSAASGGVAEVILDVSTNYLIRMTNTAGTAQDGFVGFSFYEAQ